MSRFWNQGIAVLTLAAVMIAATDASWAQPKPWPSAAARDLQLKLPQEGYRVDFDRLPNGSSTGPHQTLRNEYRPFGVWFPDGITLVRSGGREVTKARSRTMVAAPLFEGEFKCKTLHIAFLSPQKKVALYVMLRDSGTGQMAVATLAAYDATRIVGRSAIPGRLVAEKTERFHSDGKIWTKIEVSSPTANIHNLVLTGGSEEFPKTNFLLVDDLQFSGGEPVTPVVDQRAPEIVILAPTANSQTQTRFVKARVRITDDQHLSAVECRLVRDGGKGDEEWYRIAGGVGDPPPDRTLDKEWELQLTRGNGWYTFAVRANDVAGNTSEKQVRVELRAPPTQSTAKAKQQFRSIQFDSLYVLDEDDPTSADEPYLIVTGFQFRLRLDAGGKLTRVPNTLSVWPVTGGHNNLGRRQDDWAKKGRTYPIPGIRVERSCPQDEHIWILGTVVNFMEEDDFSSGTADTLSKEVHRMVQQSLETMSFEAADGRAITDAIMRKIASDIRRAALRGNLFEIYRSVWGGAVNPDDYGGAQAVLILGAEGQEAKVYSGTPEMDWTKLIEISGPTRLTLQFPAGDLREFPGNGRYKGSCTVTMTVRAWVQ
jgi:hypothetical protein